MHIKDYDAIIVAITTVVSIVDVVIIIVSTVIYIVTAILVFVACYSSQQGSHVLPILVHEKSNLPRAINYLPFKPIEITIILWSFPDTQGHLAGVPIVCRNYCSRTCERLQIPNVECTKRIFRVSHTCLFMCTKFLTRIVRKVGELDILAMSQSWNASNDRLRYGLVPIAAAP